MKTRVVSLLVIFLIFSSIIISKKQRQRGDWKGKIEYENGIEVIKNPYEPLYGEIELELEEDLVIGNEVNEKFSFFRMVDLEVDSAGNILILDQGNCRVIKTDKEGNYIKSFGRKGQGPGEFQNPLRSFIDSENKYYVNDSGLFRINIFNDNGGYENSIRINTNLIDFGVTRDLNVLSTVNRPQVDRKKARKDLVLMRDGGELLKTIASYPANIPPQLKGKLLIGNPYAYRFYFCPINEDLGVYGYTGEYKLFLINSSGDIVLIIEKDTPIIEISKKDKENLINDHFESSRKRHPDLSLSRNDIKNGIIFPKHEPFFQAMLDDGDRIYVRRFNRQSQKDRSIEFDVFDTYGYYLFKAIWPFSPFKIKDGYAYRLKMDKDTGYISIIRYTIKNWDQIIKGLD